VGSALEVLEARVGGLDSRYLTGQWIDVGINDTAAFGATEREQPR
jgi:hypothetical protein